MIFTIISDTAKFIKNINKKPKKSKKTGMTADIVMPNFDRFSKNKPVKGRKRKNITAEKTLKKCRARKASSLNTSLEHTCQIGLFSSTINKGKTGRQLIRPKVRSSENPFHNPNSKSNILTNGNISKVSSAKKSTKSDVNYLINKVNDFKIGVYNDISVLQNSDVQMSQSTTLNTTVTEEFENFYFALAKLDRNCIQSEKFDFEEKFKKFPSLKKHKDKGFAIEVGNKCMYDELPAPRPKIRPTIRTESLGVDSRPIVSVNLPRRNSLQPISSQKLHVRSFKGHRLPRMSLETVQSDKPKVKKICSGDSITDSIFTCSSKDIKNIIRSGCSSGYSTVDEYEGYV